MPFRPFPALAKCLKGGGNGNLRPLVAVEEQDQVGLLFGEAGLLVELEEGGISPSRKDRAANA